MCGKLQFTAAKKKNRLLTRSDRNRIEMHFPLRDVKKKLFQAIYTLLPASVYRFYTRVSKLLFFSFSPLTFCDAKLANAFILKVYFSLLQKHRELLITVG